MAAIVVLFALALEERTFPELCADPRGVCKTAIVLLYNVSFELDLFNAFLVSLRYNQL
jgi:hypothetical protein